MSETERDYLTSSLFFAKLELSDNYTKCWALSADQFLVPNPKFLIPDSHVHTPHQKRIHRHHGRPSAGNSQGWSFYSRRNH